MSGRRRRARRIGLALLLVLLVVVAGAGGWGWLTVTSSFPVVSGTLTLSALSAPVEVRRDAFGVPHISADTAEDLFTAQGFVHAQDRFWEMDFRRHVTSGRLSELFGASQVETDAFIRTLGWRRVAEAELDLLAPDTIRYLEAYADGVNAYLAERSGAALSLEYAVLGLQVPGYVPEPWTPADSVAWLKAMAWDLRGNMEQEIERTLLATVLPRERVEQLYPDYPFDRHEPIVTSGGLIDGVWEPEAPVETADASRPSTAGSTSRALVLPEPAIEALAKVRADLDRLPVLVGRGAGVGSNAVAVSGERTASGTALLANDPHLGPSMPSIWYQVGLHCRSLNPDCPFDVSGFSFSGAPGVVIGHNDRVAWGLTNMGPDVSDLYVERLRDDTARVADAWEPMTTREETIRVAGGKPLTITVRETRHGPLLSDVSGHYARLVLGVDLGTEPPAGDEYGIALRWTALDPGRTVDALFLLDAARDFDAMRAAAATFEVPAQNIVYADVDGHIGYQAPGRIPIRGAGDGRWPAPGWDPDYDWTGFLDFEALPWALDPAAGYIVSANQAVVGPQYEHALAVDIDLGYRSQRLVDVVAAAEPLDVDGMAALLTDAHDEGAAHLLPFLLDVPLDDAAASEARERLAAWDASWRADAAGAALYAATWRHLLAATFHDELTGLGDETRAELLPSGDERWAEVVRGLLEAPDDPWWDDISTPGVRETRDDILAASLTRAAAELRTTLGDDPGGWRWDRLHTLELRSPTFGESGIGPIEWLFNRGPYSVAGSQDVVNAVGWKARDGYAVDWVPSMRMVVDLGNLDASRWVNLTGASGHAFHENYDDQARLWADLQTTSWPFTPAAVDEASEATLTLTP